MVKLPPKLNCQHLSVITECSRINVFVLSISGYAAKIKNTFISLNHSKILKQTKEQTITRMHSSRMCTARLLTVSQHALPGVPVRGCTCPGVPAWGMYMPGGCTCLGDVPVGGVPAGGVPAQVLPSVNRMTDRYKNITLPQASFVW